MKCMRYVFDTWVGNILWRRKWQPTPVFLPGESHRGRSLVGYSPQGRKELSYFTFFLFFLSVGPTVLPSSGPASPPQHHLLPLLSYPVLCSGNSELPKLCYFFGEDNGTPLQYSCLENPMDGGAW